MISQGSSTGSTRPGGSRRAYLAATSADYRRHGLNESRHPEVWEDGMRTTGEKGTWEWWYFDAHLEDGSTVVVGFFTTKPAANKGLRPYLTIEINRPDGTRIARAREYDARDWSAAEDTCDVNIAGNRFRGDLENYDIHYADDDLTLDISAVRETESWRPATGFLNYGDEDNYFAWVVAIPQGRSRVTITTPEGSTTLSGSCYHDHNWGTVAMPKAINHWYWARAELGPYTVIASEIIADAAYNSDPIMVFNLARDGRTVVDDQTNVTLFRTYGAVRDDELGKPVSDKLKFVYEAADEPRRYEITLVREQTIAVVDELKQAVPNPLVRGVVRVVSGFSGGYYRFTGTATLRIYDGNEFVEEHVSPTAVWELMHLGEAYVAVADRGLRLPGR